MSNDRNSELNAARNALREIGEFAEQASLTGSPRTGAARLAEHYNALLVRVQELATIPEGLFTAIQASDGDYGQICVDSRMLLAHVSDRDRKNGRNADEFGSIVALAPFVNSEDLGRLIREKMIS